jgi:hypothetical protein
MTSLNGRRTWIPRSSHRAVPIYQLTNRQRGGCTVRVRGDEIAATVSAWLAELGTHSPLVEDLARAARAGDWHAVHAIGEHLSVQITSLPPAGARRRHGSSQSNT